MMRNPAIHRRNGIAFAACLFVAIGSAAAAPPAEYLGPSRVIASQDGTTLYVLLADAKQLVWVALPDGRVTRRVNLPAEPTGIAISPNSAELYVTCAAPESKVVVIDSGTGQITAAIPVGHTATGLAVTPNGKRLYVCNRFNNDVSVIDLAARKEILRVAVVREPVAAAVTPDGKTVLIGNHLPKSRTDKIFVDEVASVVTLIDTETNETTGIPLPNGSHSVRDLCVSPGGEYAYVTHLLSSFDLAPTQLDQGWANINAVSVIDTREKKLVNTVGLDETFTGCGNPWGVSCTSDGKSLVVSHAGTHELTVLKASLMAEPLAYLYVSPLAGAIPQDPRLGDDLQRRIELPGKGPRGLAVVGTKAYVAEYFSDSLAAVDLRPKDAAPVQRIALGPAPKMSLRRRGELLFNDATICYENWQSCASCHPDGRSDVLNWDLLNDGVGNFKNTKSVLLAHQTPPSMASGVRATAEAAVRAGLSHILFAERPEEEAAAIDEYLRSLRPVPSPYLVDGRLSPAAVRGKKLFENNRVGCYKCHPASLYTDKKIHDVGSRGPYEIDEKFDTPTLVEVWRTSPYLHDGRFLTIKELIVDGKHGKTRGRIEELTDTEIDDLVEYVLSL